MTMGDGECDEGQVWEAAMFASHYHLDNLVAIVDRNTLQVDGETEKIMALEPLAAKWAAFGWETIEIDGHDIGQIISGLERADAAQGRPAIIIARTVKGKGVSFMECKVEWHGAAPNSEQLATALSELSGGPNA